MSDPKTFFHLSGDSVIYSDAKSPATLQLAVQVDLADSAPPAMKVRALRLQLWYNPAGGDLPDGAEKSVLNSVVGSYQAGLGATKSLIGNLQASHWAAGTTAYVGTAILQVTVEGPHIEVVYPPRKIRYGPR